MRIQYKPFIDHVVKLDTIESNLDGDIILRGNVKGKAASLTLDVAEGLKIYRDLKAMDIEGMAKVYGA
jgi:hypothetical protein